MATLPQSPLTTLGPGEFDDAVYDGENPCAVLFSRPGCAVCARVRPVVEHVAAGLISDGGGWDFYAVDVERAPDLVQRFALAGVPQLLVFVDGELRARHAGEISAGELRVLLREASEEA